MRATHATLLAGVLAVWVYHSWYFLTSDFIRGNLLRTLSSDWRWLFPTFALVLPLIWTFVRAQRLLVHVAFLIPLALLLHQAELLLPASIAFLHAFGLILIGHNVYVALIPRSRHKLDLSIPERFLLGASVHALGIAALSLLHKATPTNILLFSSLLLLLNVGFAGYRLLRDSSPRLLLLERGTQPHLGLALMLGFTLCLALRANVYLGSDSAWYGINLERSILESGSIFESAGYVNPVHYYPKLYEITSLPLTFFQEYSTQLLLGVIILFLLYEGIRSTLNQASLDSALSSFLSVCIVSTPGIALNALEAKGDILAVLCLYCALLRGIAFVTSGRIQNLLLSCSLAVLAVAAKLTFLAYSGFLVATLLALLPTVRSLRWRIRLAVATTAAIYGLAVAIVMLRTLALTGVPLVGPRALVDFASFFGLSPNGEVIVEMTTVSAGNPSQPLRALLDLFFRPLEMPMVFFTWPSSIGAMALLVTIYTVTAHGRSIGKKRLAAAAVPASLAVAALALFLFVATPTYGGAGYYFAPGLAAPLVGLGLMTAARPSISTIARPFILGTIFLFVLLHLTLLSVGTYTPGYQRPRFHLTTGSGALTDSRDSVFRYTGLSEVAEHLGTVENCRVFVWLPPRGTPAWVGPIVFYQLPCRVSTSSNIAWKNRHVPNPFKDPDAFLRYLCWSRTKEILLPTPANGAHLPALIRDLGLAGAPALSTDRWTLLAMQDRCTTETD